MSIPLPQAINRLVTNEAAFDAFVNGSDVQSFITKSGETVPSIRAFLKQLHEQVIGIATEPHGELFADLYTMIDEISGDSELDFVNIYNTAKS
jgi:hypothetical protein